MGNRAVITTENKRLGIYLHWNGGRDSVCAFLTYCMMRGFRAPEEDCYGWARLCQVVGNFFGGDLSVGIDEYGNLDTDNWDNGVYVIKGWRIVAREFMRGEEQCSHDLLSMLNDIDSRMPDGDRMGEDAMRTWLENNDPVE